MGGKHSRDKGASWEREVAKLLTAATGQPCSRTLTETRDGNVGDIDSPFMLVVQAKVGGRPPIYDALQQAVEAAERRGPGTVPVAVIRKNGSGRRPPVDMMVLPLDIGLMMLAEFLEMETTDE